MKSTLKRSAPTQAWLLRNLPRFPPGSATAILITTSGASTEIIMCLNACCREPAMWNFNGTLTRLTAGDAYILHPCTFHHYYSDHNDPWVKIWFNGQGNLISHLLSDYQLGFNCCVRNFWKSDYLMQILQKLEK